MRWTAQDGPNTGSLEVRLGVSRHWSEAQFGLLSANRRHGPLGSGYGTSVRGDAVHRVMRVILEPSRLRLYISPC